MRAWPNTQNQWKVLRFRTRNSHHLPRIITTRTPFSPDRMRKRRKGCHCAQATERHRAQATESRQTPPQGKRCGFLEKTAPEAGGWAGGAPQPPPSPVSLFTVFQSHRTRSPISTHMLATPARGGGGLPLPAAAAAAPEKSASAKGERYREERHK